MQIKTFTFNDFYENTYIIYDDETLDCIIIDPGCNTNSEQNTLLNFITTNNLKPTHLINTHCHIDHILGNKFVSNTFKLPLSAHREESSTLAAGQTTANMFGIYYEVSPEISVFLEEGNQINLGKYSLKIINTPGHSPASISLYCKETSVLICGDVLFEGSIGRTDLPGGNYDLLLNIIRFKFFTLPEDTIVYPGHGNTTTIGKEKNTNPFFR